MDDTQGPDQPLLPQATPGVAELSAAVRKLARTSVLVVGDAMLDRYVYGEVDRVSREAPVAVLSVQRELAVPGGAGNVVRNLGALGVAVAFVSVVGDDQAGSDLTGLIGSQPGVEPWLLVQGSRATTLKTRFMAQGQQLLRTDREETSPIHPKLADRLQRIVRDAMAATSVTILSDYNKGVLAGDLPGKLIAAARAAGRRTVIDMRGTDHGRFAGADVVMPTSRDLGRATGMPVRTDAAVAEAAAVLRARHGFGAVLVTRGEEGMTLVDASGVHHFRPQSGEIFDLTGAGDTAVATLGAALAAGLDMPMAARLSSIAAGVVLGRPGLALAREGDLLAAIAPQGGALRKIVGLNIATERMERWRREGWRTALSLGSFDPLEDHHIETLNHARSAADRVVVGLRSTRQNTQPDAIRAAQLATLACVDLVVMTEDQDPTELLNALRPDLLTGPQTQPGTELLPNWGGAVLGLVGAD